MTNNNQTEQHFAPVNYLIADPQHPPTIDGSHMYDHVKVPKNDFTYIKGPESHNLRHAAILKKYKQKIMPLLLPDKPYTILVALFVITLNILNGFWAKDQNIWILILDAYLIGGTLNHTLHCCIHDFTHCAGHVNQNINNLLAMLCNIPMAIPSAISFGRYHSDHHNFLGQLYGDPDLPLPWESRLSKKHKWYKYVFYVIIELFYALRPIFMKNPSLSKLQALNYLFIFITDYVIYQIWGPYAFLFFLIAGLSSIGPHPAAVHIIAEHYEFIQGQQTYDYFGFWNFFNLNLGYHIEHHDFPNCPWYNLPKIRQIAPEFYTFLPYHTSYWDVLKKFLTDVDFNLYYRTIRLPEKNIKNE